MSITLPAEGKALIILGGGNDTCFHAYYPAVSLARSDGAMSRHWWRSAPKQRGLYGIRTGVAVSPLIAVPVAVRGASKPTALTSSRNPTYRAQLSTPFQPWPSTISANIRIVTRRFVLTESPTLSMSSAMSAVFTWPGITRKLPAFMKTSTLPPNWLVGHTVSPVYGRQPAMNIG